MERKKIRFSNQQRKHIIKNIVRRNVGEDELKHMTTFKGDNKNVNGISGSHNGAEKTQPKKTKLFAVGRFK